MKIKKIYKCNNCNGLVEYQKGIGWYHIIATGCVKPVVSRENWKNFLLFKKKK